MSQFDLIDGLSVLCLNGNSNEDYNRMPSAKRTSCSTQRTSSSRGSRSIEGDMNSLFDSEYSSFGEEKPFIYLDLPNSAWEEQRRRHSRNASRRKRSGSNPHPDYPSQGDKHQKHRSSSEETKDGLDKSPSLLEVKEQRRNCHSLSVKQSEGNINKRSNLTVVHTVTGTIPLFEHAQSKKNDDATRKRSSFRFLPRKHASIRDERAVCEHHKFNAVAEHKVKEEYDFYAKEASHPRASQRPSHPRARSMKQRCSVVQGSFASSPTRESTNSDYKKVQRSAKRDQYRYQVQQQAQSFLETCKMDYL